MYLHLPTFKHKSQPGLALNEIASTVQWIGCFWMLRGSKWHTPPKTNMEPEKDGFQKESPLPGVHFQVPC